MASPICAQQHEQHALNASVLRAELMVAALYCGVHTDYNAFVTRYQSSLTEQGHLLRAFFRRQYGRAGEQHMNSFVTRLANEESRRSTAQRARFCREAAALFDGLLGEGPFYLQALLDSPELAQRHGIAKCETP